MGHVEIIPEEINVKKEFKNIQEGKCNLESQEGDGWVMIKII